MSENVEFLSRLLSGRYQLEAELGHGGMGIVYRGTDLTMHRPVAVKLIRGNDGAELDEEVAGRFLREAKHTARIQHENIIEVYDLGRSSDGALFFVMELLRGESLSARLRREQRLGWEATVHIATQICAALHVAHAAGIIHRDLKPANIMLVDRAGDPDYVKVLDFGVSKSFAPDQETQLTHTGMLVGTIEYMAPEQIMGSPVDARTDVYSLGVLLYRMLAGQVPFHDGGVPALIHQHINVEPMPLVDRLQHIPERLDRVILRCLSKNPAERFPTMAELGEALNEALAPQNDLGLVDLEYDADPYSGGDRTEVGRSPLLGVDATIRMGAPGAAKTPRAPRPGGIVPPLREVEIRDSDPGPLSLRRPMTDDGTEVIPVEDISTAKRPVPDEVAILTRPEEPRCAMCSTINLPHARACIACGVSLSPEEQAAVRARVEPGPGGVFIYPSLPPPSHPPHSIAYRAGAPPGGSYPLQPTGWGVQPAARTPATTMWQRFLAWTKLRGD